MVVFFEWFLEERIFILGVGMLRGSLDYLIKFVERKRGCIGGWW